MFFQRSVLCRSSMWLGKYSLIKCVTLSSRFKLKRSLRKIESKDCYSTPVNDSVGNFSLTSRLFASPASPLTSSTKISAMPRKVTRFSLITLSTNSGKVLCESHTVTLRSSSNFDISRSEMTRKKLNTVYIYKIMKELIVALVAFTM